MVKESVFIVSIILVLSMLMSIPTSYSEYVNEYYIKYSLIVNGSGVTNDNTPISLSFTAVLWFNMTFINDKVKIVTKITDYSISYTSGTQTFTMSSNTEMFFTTMQEYESDLDEFYNKSFTEFPQTFSSSLSGSLGVSSMEYSYRIEYKGIGDYNGIPVYKYLLTIDVSSSKNKATGSGEIYLHIGTLIPLYYTMNINIEGEGTGVLNMKLEAKDTNLPSKSVTVVEETSKADIIAGGLPGAKIIVKGSKGSSKLIVANEGTNIGYVLIIEKTPQKLSILSIDPINQRVENKYRVITIKPGEEKTIQLGFTLDKDISATTHEVITGMNLAVLLLGIIIALVGAIIWIIHRILTKTKTHTITQEQGHVGPAGEPSIV